MPNDCCVCDKKKDILTLVWLEGMGELQSKRFPVCAAHYSELERALTSVQKHLITSITTNDADPMYPCPVCTRELTIPQVEWQQHQGTAPRYNMCPRHAKELEECRIEIARIRTPPVIINVTAVTIGGGIGRI